MENIENNPSENQQPDFHSRLDMAELQKSLEFVKSEIAKVIVGQELSLIHI